MKKLLFLMMAILLMNASYASQPITDITKLSRSDQAALTGISKHLKIGEDEGNHGRICFKCVDDGTPGKSHCKGTDSFQNANDGSTPAKSGSGSGLGV